MKKEVFILLLVILIVAPLVTAQSSYHFKQSERADVRVSCENITMLCGTNTDCFITVIAPNSSLIVDNGTMTNNFQWYNYSLNENQTSEIGIYSDFVYCAGDIFGSTTFTHKISRSGKEIETSGAIALSIITIASFLILLLFLYITIILPFKNVKGSEGEIIKITIAKYLKMGLMLVDYGLLIWLVNLLLSISNNFIDLQQYFGFTSFIFNILIYLMWPVIVIFIVWTFFELIKDSNIRKQIKKYGSSSTYK